MNYSLIMKIGLLWILAGILIATPVLFRGISRTTPVVAMSQDTSKPIVNEVPEIKGAPIHLTMESVGISVDIAPGYYDEKTHTWTLSKDKAHFATITSQPNNKTGNTFIYGHNRWAVFTKLVDAKVGDTAVITTDNNHRFTYTLREIADVDPRSTAYLQPHNSPVLTLQTCSGLWYEQRHMLTFDFTRVD